MTIITFKILLIEMNYVFQLKKQENKVQSNVVVITFDNQPYGANCHESIMLRMWNLKPNIMKRLSILLSAAVAQVMTVHVVVPDKMTPCLINTP